MNINQLRIRRKQLGMTQEEAAKYCGVSRRTYQTYEETNHINETFDQIIKMLEDAEANYILNPKTIKERCKPIFEKYPEVECAYLYGSCARREATSKSDVDILVVCHHMGMKFFSMAGELEDVMKKDIDLQTLEQLVGNAAIMENILREGVKIYEKGNNRF